MKEIDWANLSFGYMKTDYNVRCYYRDGAWGELELCSEETLNIHMAATCLHYGQEAFEGLKAYRGKDGKIRIFRPEANAQRLQSTCNGILMPELPTETFLAAVHELPIMVPVAFILEFFIVGKIAKALAFTVVTPDDRPQIITYAISICICCIMCPLMSLVATLLFKETKTFGTWIQTWAMNFLVAICYQMFYCGPLVRLIFRTIFERKGSKATEQSDALIEG